jgi:hypothetical protein
MTMHTSVEFDSDMFHPYLPDEAQVNPAVYGFELTLWFSQQLAQRGVVTSYPQSEDWGWYLDYLTGDGYEYMWCCANQEGSSGKWQCSLQPQKTSLFGPRAPLEAASALLLALRELLAQETGITNLLWE